MRFFRYLGARLEESANSAGVFDTERRIEGAQRLQTLSWDEARRTRAVVGTPEMVADRLAGLRDQLGLAGILAELNTGGLILHERVMRSMQLLCEKVQPRLRSPPPATGKTQKEVQRSGGITWQILAERATLARCAACGKLHRTDAWGSLA